MRVCVLREPPEGHWNLSMWRESSRGMTSVSSCHTGPTEAPWSPTVGPIETLHLYPARLSVGKKLTAPWPCWLRASQGQSKWKSQQTASPALRVSDHGHSAMYKDQILAGFPKGVKKKKTGRCACGGNVTFSFGATVWWDRDRASQRKYAAPSLSGTRQSAGSLRHHRSVAGWFGRFWVCFYCCC